MKIAVDVQILKALSKAKKLAKAFTYDDIYVDNKGFVVTDGCMLVWIKRDTHFDPDELDNNKKYAIDFDDIEIALKMTKKYYTLGYVEVEVKEAEKQLNYERIIPDTVKKPTDEIQINSKYIKIASDIFKELINGKDVILSINVSSDREDVYVLAPSDPSVLTFTLIAKYVIERDMQSYFEEAFKAAK